MTSVTGNRFRIRDLLAGTTLVETTRGRDIVAFHEKNFRPGRDDWAVQYLSPDSRIGWTDVPPTVRKKWWKKYQEERSV